MQTGIARTADGLLLPPQAFGPMLQAFVDSGVGRRDAHTHSALETVKTRH